MTYHLHHGECLDYLRTLPDQSVDHCIMDPPYEAESHTKARRSLKGGNIGHHKGGTRHIDEPLEISFAKMTEELRAAISIEVARVTRRWVLAFCQMEAIGLWRECMVGAGLDWVRGGVWIKPNGSPQFTGDRPGTGQETIAIAHKPCKKRWNGGGKHGIWYAPLSTTVMRAWTIRQSSPRGLCAS